MNNKFKEFVKKLNMEPNLEACILEGFSTLFEEGEGPGQPAGGSVTAAMPEIAEGKFVPSIHKAAQWIQKETAKNFGVKKLKNL